MDEFNKQNNSGKIEYVLVHTLNQKQTIQPKKIKLWYFELFVFSLLVCAFFGVISEIMLSNANIILAVLLILCLILVSVIFDMIGVAVTASDIKPFLVLNQSRNKQMCVAVKLIKNADKVNSICSDVIGDVCSILSGAAGAAICVIVIAQTNLNGFITSIALSSLIASLNVLGKALGKTYAMVNAHKIVMKVSKLLSVFVNKNDK